jgi:hypothetical protein
MQNILLDFTLKRDGYDPANAKAKELLLALMADVIVIDISYEIKLIALHYKIKDIENALQHYIALHH